MGKKYFVLNGKKYFIKQTPEGVVAEPEGEKPTDEVVVADDAVVADEAIADEVVEGEAEVTAEEAKIEEKAIALAKKLTAKIQANLGIGDIKKMTDKVDKYFAGTTTTKLAQILSGKDVFKDRDLLTKEEKIVAFYHALVTRNDAVCKALSEGSPADGGYLFPAEFMAELVRSLQDKALMRGLVRVVPMRRNSMTIPTLTNRPKVYWTSENATKTTTTANFYYATLTVYKAAAIIYASDELVEDSDLIDVVNLVIELFTEAIALEEDRVITAGSGTGEPTGLVNGGITAVACAGNLDFDDIINLVYALPSVYSAGASFLDHRNNIRELRKVKDSQNRYIWMDELPHADQAQFPLPRLHPCRANRARPGPLHRPCATRWHEGNTGVAFVLL